MSDRAGDGRGHVLVTGAAGLVGSWAVRSLEKAGYRVVATDLVPAGEAGDGAAVEWMVGDLTDGSFLDDVITSRPFAGIVHCAGVLQFTCERDPALAVAVNVVGTTALLAAAGRARIPRLVMTSTSALYGDQVRRLDESALVGCPHGLLGTYGASKWMAERVGLALHEHAGGPEFVALRLGFVFGLGKPRSAGLSEVVQRLYRALLEEEPVSIAEAGGQERWHFVHVTDVSGAIVAALGVDQDPTGVYNVAGPAGMYMPLARFVDGVSGCAGTAPRCQLSGGASSGPRLSTRRLREELGFAPRVTVAEAVRRDQLLLRAGAG